MLPFTRTLVAGAATAMLAVAAAPAVAAPVPVTDGTTTWQQARSYGGGQTSWLGYVLSTSGNPMAAANGTIAASGGAYIVKPDGVTAVPSADYTATPAASPTSFWNTRFDIGSGVIDAVAKSADVSASGTVQFTAHSGAMDVTIDRPRVVLNGDGTGGVYSSGKSLDRATGEWTTIDNTRPLFTLDASQASFVVLAGGKVAVSNLLPTMGPVEYFGSSYKAGIAGPNRDPNIFGGFSFVADTNALPVVEKTVEKTVYSKLSVFKTTLGARPFGRTSVHVEVRKAGSKTVIGSGYVVGAKLTVWLDEGTKLSAGKYTLDRKSGGKRLKKKANVTISDAKAKKTKQSAKKSSKK